uniref:Periplasmic chaperone for outer membrane proteins Skp n=1 Tax=Candidatus Kentrum eta TaxID=2126337 RepID=A0A450V773_9GAMM|nr:MAG: periplasmic chaperone for outer membrane proteins Skp [Candidatus Kentron sp. H]VFK00672.1 MAG: periplasmic chaperone for outer membrane proteins Skp [Candidatus Kentron sp. H]VFK03909.1 MAG: periplasmic chaperone for outer membrane proteins Skp [Candidatus Kentron sp. H]
MVLPVSVLSNRMQFTHEIMRTIYFFEKITIFTSIFLVAAWFQITIGAEIKVGYVDTSLVMQKAPQAESAARKIEREFSPRDKKLANQQKKITKLEDELTRDGDVMSDKKKRTLVKKIRLLKREKRRLQEEFREEFTMRRNELQNEITLVIIQAIRAVAKTEDYDLIIDTAVYAGKRVDITEKVVFLLTTEFKKHRE